MKPDYRRPEETIAVKVPSQLAAEIRRAAREDDRTVSAFLRRLLAAAMPTRSEGEQEAQTR